MRDIASAVSGIQYPDCLMSTQKGGNLGPGRGPNRGGQSPPGWKPSIYYIYIEVSFFFSPGKRYRLGHAFFCFVAVFLWYRLFQKKGNPKGSTAFRFRFFPVSSPTTNVGCICF